MSILDNVPTNHLWNFLKENFGYKELEFAFACALVRKYRGLKPQHIPLYELKNIVEHDKSLAGLTEKQIIDFLCFDTQLFTLYFRFIDTDDEHFDFDLELIQGVLSEETQRIGSKVYSSDAIRKNLFTQFSPSTAFLRLLEVKD